MTRAAVRLFVLLGVVVAAYLVLSLFDHAARADVGSLGATDPVPSASDVKNAIPQPKSIIPKSTSTKTHPRKIDKPTITAPQVHRPKIQPTKEIHAPKVQVGKTVQAPKVQAPTVQIGKTVQVSKVQAPKVQTANVAVGKTVHTSRVQVGATSRLVRVRSSQLRQSTSDVVRDASRAAVTPTRTAVVRPRLSIAAKLTSSLPKLAELPHAQLPAMPQLAHLPHAQLSVLPRRPSWPQLANLMQAQLPGLPQLPTWSRLPTLTQATWPRLPSLTQAQLPGWPQLPTWARPPSAWPQLPSVPQAELPAWPQLSSWSQLPGRQEAETLTTAPLTASVPQAAEQVCPFPQSPAFGSGSGMSGVSKPSAAQARPQRAPIPAPNRQPADHSTSTGQARDSGGRVIAFWDCRW